MNFCIEKNYRNNENLRASINRLAEKTFAKELYGGFLLLLV